MNPRKLYSPLFLAPALVLYTILFIIPSLTGLGFSFTNWNINRQGIRFIGLDNYREVLFSSGPYLVSILHTFSFAAVTVVLKTVLGLVLALLLNEGIRSKNQLRTIFFIPYTLSPLIIGIVFVAILAPEGPLNAILQFLGLGRWTHAWLVESGTALFSTMGVEIWRMTGWNMVVFLAGLQMIPKEYYEAASIDGATPWKKFKEITVTFLMPSINITLVLNIIQGIKVFDIIYALTGGGPGQLTEVINTQVFREFSDGRYGMSNTLSVIVTVFTLMVALAMKNTLTGRQEDSQ